LSNQVTCREWRSFLFWVDAYDIGRRYALLRVLEVVVAFRQARSVQPPDLLRIDRDVEVYGGHSRRAVGRAARSRETMRFRLRPLDGNVSIPPSLCSPGRG
jgi:hypothetical protein